jgi:hypothetical protein
MSNAAILMCYRESPFSLDELVNGDLWGNYGGLYVLEINELVPGHASLYGFQWLYSVLNGDSTLLGYAPGGIYRSFAPPEVATPFVVMQQQSAQDSLTFNAYRPLSIIKYLVKVVGPVTTDGMVALNNAASRVDALLGRTSGTI